MPTPPEGLTIRESHRSPADTMERLVGAVTRRGLTVMVRIDHAAAAAKAQMALRPTEVVLFGDPRGGTPLMQAVQTAGIDLPLKALVWQDAEGRTWVGYNDPAWIARRHGAPATAEPTVAAMSEALAAIAREAAGET